ncbi:MAG: hypothetical protein MUQ26_06800, partial [Armatimonadetes bacterium]|nr:hypothetical protein [Armatimonadota bacterium]
LPEGPTRLARYTELARECEGKPAEDIERVLGSAFPEGLADSGQGRFPSWTEIATAAAAGLTFENHTHSHSYVPETSPAQLRGELVHTPTQSDHRIRLKVRAESD